MARLAFNPKRAAFDLTNARALARASQLAYREKADVLRILKSWGFPSSQFFSGPKTGTQGFVAGNQDVILVAFRGTEVKQLEDLKTDLDFGLVPGKGGGHVHGGFKKALEEVSDAMALSLQELRDNDQPVFVTGHSLGAALAGLAVGASNTKHTEIAGLYTYGMPRVGNKTFAEKFKARFGRRTFRFVNNNDIVTRLPPGAIGYKHVGVVKYLNSEARERILGVAELQGTSGRCSRPRSVFTQRRTGSTRQLRRLSERPVRRDSLPPRGRRCCLRSWRAGPRRR